jgi:hypothetical protein
MNIIGFGYLCLKNSHNKSFVLLICAFASPTGQSAWCLSPQFKHAFSRAREKSILQNCISSVTQFTSVLRYSKKRNKAFVLQDFGITVTNP